MKSIMEEASSIAKAIEKGWARAGKPKEFTVRVFEEPQKNFIGMTTKPAKVGLLFKEQAPQQSRIKEAQRLVEKREAEKAARSKGRVERTPRFERERKPQVKRQVGPQEQELLIKKDKWTDEMIQKSQSWLEGFLKSMRLTSPFSVDVKNYTLTVCFEKPLADDKEREQQLFKNCSYLLLQALKYQFKRGLKGYKIILTSR